MTTKRSPFFCITVGENPPEVPDDWGHLGVRSAEYGLGGMSWRIIMGNTVASELERAGRELIRVAREIREQNASPIDILQCTLRACCEAQAALTCIHQLSASSPRQAAAG